MKRKAMNITRNITRNTPCPLRAALLALLVPSLLLPPALAAPARPAVAKPPAQAPGAAPAATAGGALPAPWKESDIGKVGVRGVAHAAGGTWTITGSGEDIFGPSDSFHFVWRKWHGDGRITARVVRYQRRDMWTKVGVMARESRAPGSKFADVLVTPDKGAEMQWRAGDGADAQTTGQTPSPAPFWVRLVRAGDTLTGYASLDGRHWQPRGKATVPMAEDILLGLCVTSHRNDAVTEATVDSVEVDGG
jgi:regulation of enolase protein 1 (concanavalin A-like superfamily)